MGLTEPRSDTWWKLTDHLGSHWLILQWPLSFCHIARSFDLSTSCCVTKFNSRLVVDLPWYRFTWLLSNSQCIASEIVLPISWSWDGGKNCGYVYLLHFVIGYSWIPSLVCGNTYERNSSALVDETYAIKYGAMSFALFPRCCNMRGEWMMIFLCQIQNLAVNLCSLTAPFLLTRFTWRFILFSILSSTNWFHFAGFLQLYIAETTSLA